MACNVRCLPPRACSDFSAISSASNSIAFRTCFDPLRRIRRFESSSLLRITIVARSPPQAPHNPHQTTVCVPKIVEPQNHATKLFSSTSTVFMPSVSLKKWNLTEQHLLAMTACLAGSAMTAFFVAAIPTLLAFKRAAESLENLLEVTREELPGTMAAVRLSGMEISDLTMELSDLGQEISSGVKSSARAVRAAQDGFRRMSSMASMAFVQEQEAVPVGPTKPGGVALVARDLREMLVQLRLIFHSFLTLKYLTGWATKFWNKRKTLLLGSISNSYSLIIPQK